MNNKTLQENAGYTKKTCQHTEDDQQGDPSDVQPVQRLSCQPLR
ncbi:hypothetical protein EC142526_04922 [Escherichia coli O145:H28]|nr:hypothetical protein EC142526_04922 [Escherichia coli O145:H28]GEH01277.1 hypothetical protein EC150811_04870 [Escherichia coli O145:H28]GEH23130.1 hypothetical protein EC150814_05199 [Escherichia coli O145:H28]STK02015.1 Uncharacterised protein [Escherichia coli]